jgi:hypothetical protein
MFLPEITLEKSDGDFIFNFRKKYSHFEIVFGLSFLPECINGGYETQIHGHTYKN